ncbi:hypothetical protein GIB67_002834 [Kingdonia uniflora]|uniref:ATP synthase mitochondrial F1 complex assembly factor 2 n=1 Tax=Kingdonia uniflora TaxID=39325 RepID=A0A7J7M5E0_9MAGN|nr:hypothetical protein GIB67_002834 [Kingdonia uniflora]
MSQFLRHWKVRSNLLSMENLLPFSSQCSPQRKSFANAAEKSDPETNCSSSSSFTFSSGGSVEDEEETTKKDDTIYIKKKSTSSLRDPSSVTMPMSFMTGSVVGKRFYKQVTTREAEDGNGWNVMLDYRTLKTPSKRNLKLPSLALAKAIAAEWEYQDDDGIRPFMMPLMRLACTALERVPLTRTKIIEHLISKFHQDLVFSRSPGDDDLTRHVYGMQLFYILLG